MWAYPESALHKPVLLDTFHFNFTTCCAALNAALCPVKLCMALELLKEPAEPCKSVAIPTVPTSHEPSISTFQKIDAPLPENLAVAI